MRGRKAIFNRYSVAALVLLCFCAARTRAEEPARSPAEVAKLVGQLDDDSFAVRELAFQKLLELGLPALPELQKAENSSSFEQRQRVRVLAAGITRRVLREAFVELARQDDEVLDLEQGMWLVSRLIDPLAKRDDLTRQLDELAEKVRKRLGKDVNPRTADPTKVVDAIRHVLFTDLGFIGNKDDYNNPRNSSLAHVLATRKGLPILLSQLVVSVGRRLNVPLVGIGLPGRFMVMYDGSQAPEGFAKTNIVIDAFGGGIIMTNETLAMTIPGFDPEVKLEPYGRRETLARILRNIVNDFSTAKQTPQAELAQEFLNLVDVTRNADPFK